MGEYADMMLDGTCCSSCGVFLGGNDGYPVQCRSCAADDNHTHQPRRKMGKATKKLLVRMYEVAGQCELFGETSEIFPLFNRGYAERCKRANYWQLTAAGKAKAAEILGRP